MHFCLCHVDGYCDRVDRQGATWGNPVQSLPYLSNECPTFTFRPVISIVICGFKHLNYSKEKDRCYTDAQRNIWSIIEIFDETPTERY